MLKIVKYSSYDDYTVTSNTENISDVVDKLVRLAAKITERYASDIYYDIKSLYNSLEEHEPYDRVLFFRESGVWTVSVEDLNTYVEHIQAWKLTHDPENMITTLVRVDGRKEGYNEALKRFGIQYEFDMMLEEIRVLGKLETRDTATFIERSHFFTKDVIKKTMEDYVEELKNYVDKLPNKNCKGVPYKRIKGRDIFVVDLQKKVYSPLEREINRLQYATNYNEIYGVVRSFMNDMIHLPYNAPKSKAWIDAYKGEGAFYTLKNLVMFHGCGIKVDKFDVKFEIDAVAYLNQKLGEYKGEGWRMFALMKKVIKDNNFDFHKRMNEIYND